MDAIPPYVVHIDDVPEQEGCYPPPFDAEKGTIYRDLGRAAGSRSIGFAHERLLPGRRLCFTHAHSHEEELVYVISGTCAVRLVEPGAPPREIPLRAGHAVSFPAGTGIAHTFVNHGSEECVLFVVGERRPDEDRVFYPEDPEYDAHHARTRPERHWEPDPPPANRCGASLAEDQARSPPGANDQKWCLPRNVGVSMARGLGLREPFWNHT